MRRSLRKLPTHGFMVADLLHFCESTTRQSAERHIFALSSCRPVAGEIL
jgi:hypothetical protein